MIACALYLIIVVCVFFILCFILNNDKGMGTAKDYILDIILYSVIWPITFILIGHYYIKSLF